LTPCTLPIHTSPVVRSTITACTSFDSSGEFSEVKT
jgi:hypothetical protein